MTSIRNNLAKLFGVLAVLFILFILFDWGMDLPSLRLGARGSDVIGTVNGEKVSYNNFSELVRRMTEAQRSQSGTEVDDETERQIRSQVWTMMVNQLLINQEIERLGITVTDQEIIDLVHGPNPPEMLVSQFRDSLGRFNREAYERAIQDPQNRQAWVQVEQQLRTQRKQEKLQSIINASAIVTEGDLRQRFVERTTTLSADYALFDPLRMVPDSAVRVSDQDVEAYYASHQDNYKVAPARKLKYVLFRRVPSPSDSADVLNELNRLLEQVRAGMDFRELASTYSEIPLSDAFFKHGELSREKENAAFSARKGEIVGPVADYDGLHLIRIVDERKGTGEFVRARHILIRPAADSVAARERARDLARQLRSGAPFEDLARAQSEDPGSAALGGDLGWAGRGSWVKEFENAAFKANVGEIVGPVRTQFGWHIIQVVGRDQRELKLETITMKVKPSPQTVEEMHGKAEDFAYLATEEGFERAAEFSSYQVRETPEFEEGGLIPGIGFSESVARFAFSRDAGAISDPISVAEGVGVFMVSAVREEGVRPFAEVSGAARSAVLRQKKLEHVRLLAEEAAAKARSSGDLRTAVAGVEGVLVGTTGPFRPTEAPAGVGRDESFIGMALKLTPGELSNPFEGVRGYYIVKLLSKTPFDTTAFLVQRSSLREELQLEKRNKLSQDWLTALRARATIEDYRDRFYR
jgi:parvulin-like peptidyl-prolyl isomerase